MMSLAGNRGNVYFTRDVTTIWWFLINFIVNKSLFLCVFHTQIVFYCLKTRQPTRDTWLGTLMRLDFVARIVCWIYVYIMRTSTEYISLQTVPLVTGNSFHWGGVWLLAMSYWKGDSHLKHISARGGEGGWLWWTACFVWKRCFCKNFCATYKKTPLPGHLF